MWTVENRARYDRSRLRYPSDLTDEEWALVRPQIPRAKRGGNKRSVDERAVMHGLIYVLSTGCQWRAIPKDLPPRGTVNHSFCRWQHDGTLDRLHHALDVPCREQADREASPTAAIIDSQRVKSAAKGAPHRSAGLRWRQKDQGEETARPGRHAGLADARHRTCRRYPGPRWRGSGDGDVVWAVSLPAEALRRRGLPGAEVPTGPGPCLPRGERRDRAALRHGQVRGAAQARSAQCPEPSNAPSPG